MFFAATILEVIPFVAIGLIGVALLLTILLSFIFPPKNKTTKDITFCAAAVSLSYVMSYAKISPVQSGGSITLASCIPLLIYCYVFGIRKGMIAAFIYSCLQILQEPYIVGFWQVILDYILPFSAMGLIALLKPLSKKLKGFDVAIMLTIIYAFRFFCHLISGVIYWLPSDWIGSLIYNATYLPADFAIALATTIVLIVTGSFKRLADLLRKMFLPPQPAHQNAALADDQATDAQDCQTNNNLE